MKGSVGPPALGADPLFLGQFHWLQHLLNKSTARLSEPWPTNPV